MNCYEHPIQPAVAQCTDCGKGLCVECTSVYSLPICSNCNKQRINVEKGGIIKELVLTYGVGIVLGALFARWTNAGIPTQFYIPSYRM